MMRSCASTADFDETTQVLIDESTLEVIPRQYQDMLLDMNERDRFTFNAGFQWRASEDTELQLDVNHSELKTMVVFSLSRILKICSW